MTDRFWTRLTETRETRAERWSRVLACVFLLFFTAVITKQCSGSMTFHNYEGWNNRCVLAGGSPHGGVCYATDAVIDIDGDNPND